MTYFFVFCNILFIKEINNLSPMAKNLVTLDLDNTSYEFRPYGTCSTAAATAAKAVSITGFTLCTGATVIVKFTYTNTATNPTLNVNSTGAKSLNNAPKIIANNTYEFRYNGSTWNCISVSSVPQATKNSIGGIKTANDRSTSSSMLSGPINSGGTTATRYYGIETTSDGIGFVNVPWTDYTLPEATNDTLGGIKLDYGLESAGSGKVRVACDGTTIGTDVNGYIKFGVNVAPSTHIDDLTGTGVYDISGTRNANANDDLPITNAGAYSGKLFVYTADGCVSQYLHLLNAGGGDSNYYIRTQQNGTWSAWAKLQTNVEVGLIDQVTMDGLIDNGIYSGILATGETFETFVIITINNYVIAESAGIHHISQLKYSLVAGSGEIKIEKRTRDAYGFWTEWETVGGTSEIPVASTTTRGGITFDKAKQPFYIIGTDTLALHCDMSLGTSMVSGADYCSLHVNKASFDNIGGIKLGYTQTGKNYPVVLDGNSKAYVNVPWTNENNNYSKKLNVATSVSSNKLLKNTTYVLINQTINVNDIEEPSDGEVATYNLILKNCDIQFNKKIYWHNGIKPENTNILFIEVVITGVKTGSTTIYTATFGTYTEV